MRTRAGSGSHLELRKGRQSPSDPGRGLPPSAICGGSGRNSGKVHSGSWSSRRRPGCAGTRVSHLSGASPPDPAPHCPPECAPLPSLPPFISPIPPPPPPGVSQVPGPQQDVLRFPSGQGRERCGPGGGGRERAQDPFAAVTRAPGRETALSRRTRGGAPAPADERRTGPAGPSPRSSPSSAVGVGARHPSRATSPPPLTALGPRLPGPSGRPESSVRGDGRGQGPGRRLRRSFTAGKGAGGGAGEEGRDGRGAAGREQEERGGRDRGCGRRREGWDMGPRG